MPFCPKCGASVDGRFCPGCGTAIAAPGGYAPAAPGAPPPPPVAASSGLQDNVAGALCYSLGFITGILFLVLEPYNKNRLIRFHAFQSIFVSVIFTIAHYVVFFLGAASWGVFWILSPLISLLFICLWLFMMWKTYNNEKILLPAIGDIAEKQAG
jgi:uncharacterized membrane protein